MKKLKKYLKKNRNFFILLLLLAGFVQCDEIFSGGTHLNKNDIPWYNEGDTLLFKSGSDTHTFVVEEVSWDSEYLTIGKSYDTHYTSVQQINCTDTCYIYKTGIYTLEQRFSINGIRFEFNYKNSGYSLKVGNYFVNNLYKRDLRYYRENPPYCIQTVFIHLNYGLVAYELVNGDRYMMDENTYLNLNR